MDVPSNWYVENRILNARLAFVSSAMGFQGDSGASVPLGVVEHHRQYNQE
ncbi:MAG: hypothetical protein ACSHW0_01970 [Thalassotalea sp.]